MWAKKQEANRKREMELKQARIQYFEQRKVANEKQQKQYSRSDETDQTESTTSRYVISFHVRLIWVLTGDTRTHTHHVAPDASLRSYDRWTIDDGS